MLVRKPSHWLTPVPGHDLGAFLDRELLVGLEPQLGFQVERRIFQVLPADIDQRAHLGGHDLDHAPGETGGFGAGLLLADAARGELAGALGQHDRLGPVDRTRTRERTGDISVMPLMISFTYSGGAR